MGVLPILYIVIAAQFEGQMKSYYIGGRNLKLSTLSINISLVGPRK